MMDIHLTRREFLKNASATLISIPVLVISGQAYASSNKTLRLQLKYQDTPKDNMDCLTCLEFVPGKSDKDLGGCKVIPGDDEISPKGYCISWNSM
jgi:hypothetical protein